MEKFWENITYIEDQDEKLKIQFKKIWESENRGRTEEEQRKNRREEILKETTQCFPKFHEGYMFLDWKDKYRHIIYPFFPANWVERGNFS